MEVSTPLQARLTRKTGESGPLFLQSDQPPVWHLPQKNDVSLILCTNLYDCKHIYLCFSCTTFRNSATNSTHTADPKMHHPATDSSVLSLQCGKATAVFVLSLIHI